MTFLSVPSSPSLSRPPRLERAATDFVLSSRLSSYPSASPLPHEQHETSDIPFTSSLLCSTPFSPSSLSCSPSSPSSSCSSSCSSSSGHDSATTPQHGATVWSCGYGCGKRYKRSSGRSIRRHITSCFRRHWPGGVTLTEEQVSALISSEQEKGRLVTGLRRWKMRQSRRRAEDLPDAERWTCPFGCGKRYRSTSSRSIQNHANGCANRNDGGVGDVDVKRLKTEHDEVQRRVCQQKDEREIVGVKRTAGVERQGGESRSSDDNGAEGEASTARRANDLQKSSSLSSSSSASEVLHWWPPSPSPVNYLSDPSSLGGREAHERLACTATSASTFASLDLAFQSWDLACCAEPALVAHRLQRMEQLLLQQSYDDTLTRQQHQVAAELQQLLLDIYARHGTEHPVFNNPVMVSRLAWSLTQETVTAATARPSTTLPTQVGSFKQPPFSPPPTCSSDGLLSSRCWAPVSPVPAEDGDLSDFDAALFTHTPQADALDASAAAAFPRCASPGLSVPDFFPIDRPPSTLPLWPFTPARPLSRLARPPSACSPFLPFLSPSSDHLDALVLEQPCHNVDPSQSNPGSMSPQATQRWSY